VTAPSDAASIARLAGLLADPTRVGMCLALLDGTAWTAGELARSTGVARSTASEHLDQLVAGGLLAEERQGRHRYLRITTPAAAQLIESLAVQAGPGHAPRSLRAVRAGEAMARGRTCYDHLAGRLGVAVMDALVDRGLVSVRRGVALTEPGHQWLATLGVDVAGLEQQRRPLVRPCIDWTERRPHLAGSAGAALCTAFVDHGWVERGHGRVMTVTEAGHRALRQRLGITPAELRLPA
jgi:DNA-binding transcriptional ArsR family regulator